MNLFLCVSSLFTFSRCNTQSKQVNIWSKINLGNFKGGNWKWETSFKGNWMRKTLLKVMIFLFFFSDGELYSGTVADFSASDSLIIKDSNLRTEQYDFKQLNGMNILCLEEISWTFFYFSAWFCQCSRGWWSCLLLLSRGCGGAHQLWQSKFNC